jgi:D-alanyl-D-alanine carboxypeptidase
MNENSTSPSQPEARRSPRRGRIAIGTTAAAALVVGALAFGAAARSASVDPEREALEQRLQSIVDAGYPAAQASITRPDGTSIEVVVGDGDLNSGRETPEGGEVRVGSNTKMFVATVVMQLVDEGVVSLDAPIDTYLPGVIAGEGIDGTAITVRHLLQHTAGLPENAEEFALDAFATRELYMSPRDMVDVGLAQPASFAPGERFEYSNTNYFVLGLLVERVTQRALWEEIDERIVQPLDLEHTYLPGPAERELRGDHIEGYHADYPGELQEITDIDTSTAWSAGALVSTPTELNLFMQALLRGDLVSDESLALMQQTVPAPDPFHEDNAYGLGLQSFTVDDGLAWGHGGDIQGTQTRNAVAPDGTAVTIAVTALPWAIEDPESEEPLLEKYQVVFDALDETLNDQ